MRRGSFALLTVLAVTGCDEDDLPELGSTVLVVIGDADQSPADQGINARLVGLEYETRIVDEASLTDEDLSDDVGYVLISSSVRSSATFDAIADTPRPVFITQAWVADDFGVTSADAKIRESSFVMVGEGEDLGSWTVVDGGHPATGDTSDGPVAMWSVDMGTVTPMVDVANSPARVLAEFLPDFGTLLVYERGDELATGGSAPQKRALMALGADAPVQMTDQGWTLFDSAVNWTFE